MPTLTPDLVNAIIAGVEATSITQVSKDTRVSYSTVRCIYHRKRRRCNEVILNKLSAKFGGTGTGTLPSAVVRPLSPPAVSYPAVPLRMVYSDQYWDDLRTASKLIAIGTSLSRLMQRKTWIEGILSRRGSIQVLFVDPHSSAFKYSAMQEIGAYDASALRTFRRTQSGSLAWLLGLAQAQNEYADKIEFLKIDYALTFGLDVIELPGGARSIYVRFYPLVKQGEEDRPIVEVRGDNPLWHEFFESQLASHLAMAEPCDARCIARLLKSFRSASTKVAMGTRSSGLKGGIERGGR
jgi:hypothetical protein